MKARCIAFAVCDATERAPTTLEPNRCDLIAWPISVVSHWH